MRGYTILELVVSVAVSAPLLAAIISLLISLHRVLDTSKQEYLSSKTATRTVEIISHAVNRSDSYPLNIPPRVHHSGKITFTDNTNNPIMESSRAPALESSALTSISLTSNSIYTVLSSTNNTGTLEFIGCLRFLVNRHDTSAKIFVGLSQDNTFELSGQTQRIIGQPRCRKFTLQSHNKSMIIATNADSTPLLIKYLLPVSTYSTLYLDSQGRLRYLAHRGAANIENQPLLENVKSLDFKFSIQGKLYQLDTELSGLNETPINFTLVNKLSRLGTEDFYNLLENHEI